MKKLTILLFVLVCQTTMAQKYFTRTGTTNFKASVAAFEPVEAENNSSTAILKASSGEIAAQLFINAFNFKVALMQEHFNENYMDSDQYPKATFRGKLEGFSLESLKTKKEFPLKGTLTVKGKKKKIKALAKVVSTGNRIKLKSNFIVKPEDFGIKIPGIVRKKIAKEIHVDLAYELVEKK